MADTAPGSKDNAIRTTEEAEQRSRGARLFDIRRLIGALFVVYGVILIVVGATDGHKALSKASGVRINLWTGIGMLVVGVLMLVWAFAAPVRVDDDESQPDDTDDTGARPQHA